MPEVKPSSNYRMYLYTHKIGDFVLVTLADKYNVYKPVSINSSRYDDHDDPALINMFSTSDIIKVVIEQRWFYFNDKLILMSPLCFSYSDIVTIGNDSYTLSCE